MIRKLFIILCILFLYSSSSTGGITDTISGVIARKNAGGVVPLCTSCTPGDPADKLCEDADNAGALWCTPDTAYIDGTNTVSAQALTAGLACTERGTNGLRVVVTGAQGELAANGYDLTFLDQVNIHGYFVLISETLDDTDYVTVSEVWDDNSGSSAALTIVLISGVPKFRLLVNTQAGVEEVLGGAVAAPGTWQEVEFNWKRNTETVFEGEPPVYGAWFRIDGGTLYTSSDNSITLDERAEEVRIGSTVSGSGITSGDDITFEWDMIEVDNDAMPGACAE